jgi:hypothetical protein
MQPNDLDFLGRVARIDAMQSANAAVFILRENLFRSEKERLKTERNA